MTDDRYTSVWSDLNQVEFSQGFLQAGPYRTRYLHAGDRPSRRCCCCTALAGTPRPTSVTCAATASTSTPTPSTSSGTATPPSRSTRWRSRTTSTTCCTCSTPSAWSAASLSGESLGGWVAARLAQLHPGRVVRIGLNTPGGTMANPQVMERLYALSIEAAKDPSWERVKARLEWLVADPAMVTDDLIRTRQMIFQQPGWLKACEMNMALQDPEIRKRNMLTDDDLRAIQAETLVIWTTKDPSGPVGEGRRIASLIPDASLAVIENAGHWPQYEQAETFNRVHLDFLLGRRDRGGDRQ